MTMIRHFKFLSSDKKTTIHGIKWIPDGEISCILQISHGMVEYIERYDEFARYLNKFGILVIGNDHLGHGKSINEESGFGYFADENGGACICRDLLYVTKKAKKDYPGTPIFLLGHSMGSFMARRYIINYGKELDGAIIMGTAQTPIPVLAAGRVMTKAIEMQHGPHYRSEAIDKMAFGSYNKKIENPKHAHDWLTHDMEIVEKYESTPEDCFVFTARAYDQMLETMQYMQNPRLIEKIPKDLPIMIISGDEDPVGDYGKGPAKAYAQLFDAGVEDLDFELVGGGRHEVLNEIGREDTYEIILQWLFEKLSAKEEKAGMGNLD